MIEFLTTKYVATDLERIGKKHFGDKFVVDELKTKPDVRKYTLAHLAGLSGYGSYSTFAVNFKRVMKQSPSTYIKNLG